MLTIAYDGTDYCGWQIQKNGVSIEEVLTGAVRKVTGEEMALCGASRTDSGVHALGNVVTFDTESSIPAEIFARAVNTNLPHDIREIGRSRHSYTQRKRRDKGICTCFPHWHKRVRRGSFG